MPKRGQVTVFVIVGMLILAVGGLIFFLTKITAQAESPLSFSSASVKNYVTSCLEKTVEEGIFFSRYSFGL